MDFVKCDFCDKEFIKGRGHLCWCQECSKQHPMCDPCYKKALSQDLIKDTPENVMKYNDHTLEDGK